MHAKERQAFNRLRDALIGDFVIDDILEKLSHDEMELIGDSLIGALNGSCDEFCHRLLEELLAYGLEHDSHDKWKAVQVFLENIW